MQQYSWVFPLKGHLFDGGNALERGLETARERRSRRMAKPYVLLRIGPGAASHTLTLDLQRDCLKPLVTRLPTGGLLAHPVRLPRSVPIRCFSRHRSHLECDSWRPLAQMTTASDSVVQRMTTHKSQGNGRASPPLALVSRVPGNPETEISGHRISPLLHRVPVFPMPIQHVCMLISVCFNFPCQAR
jgi:hypothetical protein